MTNIIHVMIQIYSSDILLEEPLMEVIANSVVDEPGGETV